MTIDHATRILNSIFPENLGQNTQKENIRQFLLSDQRNVLPYGTYFFSSDSNFYGLVEVTCKRYSLLL